MTSEIQMSGVVCTTGAKPLILVQSSSENDSGGRGSTLTPCGPTPAWMSRTTKYRAVTVL